MTPVKRYVSTICSSDDITAHEKCVSHSCTCSCPHHPIGLQVHITHNISELGKVRT